MGDQDSGHPWPQGSEGSRHRPSAPREMRGNPPSRCLEVAGHTRCPQALQGGIQRVVHPQEPGFCFPSTAAGISPSQAKAQLQSSLTSSGNGTLRAGGGVAAGSQKVGCSLSCRSPSPEGCHPCHPLAEHPGRDLANSVPATTLALQMGTSRWGEDVWPQPLYLPDSVILSQDSGEGRAPSSLLPREKGATRLLMRHAAGAITQSRVKRACSSAF